MAKKVFKFPGISISAGNVKIKVDLDRFEKQFQKAQFWLDTEIMTDMIPLMPFRDGNFVNVTKAQSASLAGSGKVIAGAAPTGRFLYEGKVMVDPDTGSPWAKKGAKKVVTNKPLNYSNPKAVPHWFEKAKKQYGDDWVKGVKKIAGGK